MGCWHGGHGWHGCGPGYGGPYARGWHDPVDWYEDADWPVRLSRRPRQPDPETAPEDLEMKLEQLRAAIRRVEAQLASLGGSGDVAGRP